MQWFNLHEENALVAQDTAIRCRRQRKIAPMPAGTLRMRPRLIESRQNPRVKELRAALARSGRTTSGLIAIEGEHLVAEAMRSHLRFASVFLREGYEPAFAIPENAEHLQLPADVFASAVSTEQPQGIAALVHPPAFSSATLFSGPAPLILVLEALQDPGNVGTLMRSAEAFAASGVLLLPGTASPCNPKALRASAGSAFRVPAIAASEEEALELLAQHNISPIAAVAREGTPIGEAPLAGPCALLIGNEGAGLSETLLAAAAHRITIPMPGKVESLNAAIAGSLLLYEAARQRQQQPLSSRLERSGIEGSAVLTSRTTSRQRPTS
jgi:TrmH family RNA methyltransferase